MSRSSRSIADQLEENRRAIDFALEAAREAQAENTRVLNAAIEVSKTALEEQVRKSLSASYPASLPGGVVTSGLTGFRDRCPNCKRAYGRLVKCYSPAATTLGYWCEELDSSKLFEKKEPEKPTDEDIRGHILKSPPIHEDVIPVSRVWLAAILRSLGGSIVIDEYQMADAQEKHNTIEMLKTADPPTWIIRLGVRFDDKGSV